MIQGGKTLSDYILDVFIGDAIIIDVRGKNIIEPNLSKIKENDIVFFQTGHSNAYNNYFIDNPVISKETANELINKKIRIVELDSFTPDNAPYTVHKMFFRRNILIVENLVNLDNLQGRFQ
jgi:kynurenine formamidase